MSLRRSATALLAFTALALAGTSAPASAAEVNCVVGMECSATVSTPNTSFTVRATGGTAFSSMSVQLDQELLNCPGYNELARDSFNFSVFNDWSKTITRTIIRPTIFDTLLALLGRDQACFQALYPFQTRRGFPALQEDDGTFTGVLPDCDDVPATEPCKVFGRIELFRIVMRVRVPANPLDPRFR